MSTGSSRYSKIRSKSASDGAPRRSLRLRWTTRVPSPWCGRAKPLAASVLVFARRYDSRGVPARPGVPRQPPGLGDPARSVRCPAGADGDFVVVWTSLRCGGDDSGRGVNAPRLRRRRRRPGRGVSRQHLEAGRPVPADGGSRLGRQCGRRLEKPSPGRVGLGRLCPAAHRLDRCSAGEQQPRLHQRLELHAG